jgi:hypothetical protein
MHGPLMQVPAVGSWGGRPGAVQFDGVFVVEGQNKAAGPSLDPVAANFTHLAHRCYAEAYLPAQRQEAQEEARLP